MAYPNNYFPVGYQPYQMPQLQPQMAQQQQAQLGFIRVPSEDVARSYPLAPNTSGTFIDENLPYIYTKTMGASQFEPPRFEKYRLVKEETVASVQPEKEESVPEYITREEFEQRIAELVPAKRVVSTKKEREQ